jgi:hypothetical protein
MTARARGLLITLLALHLSGAAQGRSKHKEPLPKAKAPAAATVVRSPDRLKFVEVIADGRVRLNGHHLLGGPGRILGGPIWRQDSRALAFLLRSAYGLQLYVLPDLEAVRPLVWTIPSLAERQVHLFWIAAQRVGIGPAALMPRVVVSWTTTTAYR